MDSKVPSIHVLIMLMTVVMGVLENRPIDAMVVAVLFMFVSIIAYIPFVGFLLCLSAATRIMDWFGYGGFVAVVYWIVTIWALIVYIASSALVVMRIIHRL